MILLILVNLIYVSALMFVAWCIYLRCANPGIIDVFWPIAITTTSLHYLHPMSFIPVTMVFAIIVSLWGMRLAGYLFFTRILPQQIEKRYQTLSSTWRYNQKIGFLLHFQLQGILACVVGTPFLFITQQQNFNIVVSIIISVISVSLVMEIIADQQLFWFKCKQAGGVCTLGLWRYSRHPNYFFEWLIWLGFAVAGLQNSLSFISLISPGLLLWIMLTVTIPLTEASSLQSKGKAYQRYQQMTSRFMLRPPKKDIVC